MPKYIHSLDYLRGAAAVLVCLFHFSNKLDYLPAYDIVKSIGSFGHFGVEIFFIISGFVIPYGMAKGGYALDKFFIFLKKRLIRIEPPYLICVIFALFLNYLTSLSPTYTGLPFRVDFLQIGLHFGYLNPYFGKDWLNPVFWTLAIEFQYYLLIALVFPVIKNSNRIGYTVLLLFFNYSSFYFSREYIFHFSIFFTTGILLFRHFENKMKGWEQACAILFVTAFLILNYSFTEVCTVYVTSLIILVPLPKNGIASFFGNISYSLYLLHFIIGLRIINLTQRFSFSLEMRYAMIIVALIVSVLTAYYYSLFIEEPFKRRSQKIRYAKNPANDHLSTLSNAAISKVMRF